jgi:hypothetical protein
LAKSTDLKGDNLDVSKLFIEEFVDGSRSVRKSADLHFHGFKGDIKVGEISSASR